MRVNTSSSRFVAFSFFYLGSSLPFFPHEISLKPRATYSVVPVDGGSSATTNTAGQGEVTIVKTVVETPSPTTQIVIETDTLPPTTEVIVSTQTVPGPKETQTVDITITPSATSVTVTATEYSVIDNSAPTTIVLPPTTIPKSQTSSKPSNTSVSSTNTISESGSSSILKSSTSISSPDSTSTAISAPPASSPRPTNTIATSYTSSFTSVTLTSSTTTSYDDGQWHTTYPSWTNGTATLRTAATPVQTNLPFHTDSTSSDASLVSRFIHRFTLG